MINGSELIFTSTLSTVHLFTVHQDITTGIPELIAEVAKTLYPSKIKADIPGLCCKAGKSKTQCISPVGRDPL